MKPQHYIQFGVIIFFTILICFFFYQKSKVESEKLENTTNVSKSDSLMLDSSLIITDVDTSYKDIQHEWAYGEKIDQMSSTPIYLAQVISGTVLNFEFPYDGGASAYLTIRNKDGLNKAYLEISKGQFLIHSSAKMWKLRFDQDETDYYLFNPTSSGNSRIAFVSRAAEFISKVKKHKRLFIEAEFYQEGLRQIEFDISNLKWDH